MPGHEVRDASTNDGLAVAPALATSIAAANIPLEKQSIDRRVVTLCALAIALGVVAAIVAQALSALILLLTNVSYFGRFTLDPVPPSANHLGAWAVAVPIVGGIVVGFMARYGSAAIRGHGIPEAMEQVLTNKSRVPARMMFLKPLSAAVSIGTGGPFGTEGPIIATGGSIGSVLGQLLRMTATERKILLAAGAAAGMAATFGAPVAAVLLAVELLLFEFRARSIIPVALGACAATAVRVWFLGVAPFYKMPDIAQPGAEALAAYVAIGALVGLASVAVTKALYWIEDRFEHVPMHWMWWPALGGIAVGVVGLVEPRTLGVGPENIEAALSAKTGAIVLLGVCAWKFLSWSIALGSGTSGGTLAPLLTLGSGLGAALGAAAALLVPGIGMDTRIAALVGMAAMFAGASRALLTAVVFAFEATHQGIGLLPLLGGCGAAYLVSALLMRTSIMTEKIERRGIRVASEYVADHLDQVMVGDRTARDVVTVKADDRIEDVRNWILAGGPGTTHQGFPVVDADDRLVGVITRRDLFGNATDRSLPVRAALRRAPAVIHEDHTLREAADHMVREQVGRLPVVSRDDPSRVVGIVTRSDLLDAHRSRIDEASHRERVIEMPGMARAPSPADRS